METETEKEKMQEIYLDNSATTRTLPEVRTAMVRAMDLDYGNPSSMHKKGVDAEHMIREARETIAATLKVDAKEIFFTSGGTESNNLALTGCAMANQRQGKHLITTAIEHASVSQTMDFLEKEGFEVTRLMPDRFGRVTAEQVAAAVRPDTILVSVMMVNNEIGTIEPVEEIGRAVKAANPRTLFHVDAIQAYGKLVIRPRRMKIDLLSVSGHKIHGPKGSGFLYVRDSVKIRPILFGGGQQNGLRSGTENVPGIAGLGVAAGMAYQNPEEKIGHMAILRERLAEGLAALPEVTVNGPGGSEAAPQIVSASFAGIRSEVLLHALEAEGIMVSAGSACSSNKKHAVSATLAAIRLDPSLTDCTVRFSLSVFTTEEEIDTVLEVLERLLPKLRRFVRK